MTTQVELPLFSIPRKRGRGPQATQKQVDAFILSLYRRGWRNSESLGAETEGQKRLLRATAEASGGHIISGQAGYKLAFEATADEHRTFVNQFKHQIEKMQRRVVETEKVYHTKAVPACLRDRVVKDRPAA